ncbi:hypothetical protein OIO90_003931 [Microbotryomycetes sp. JL221]|nr:hypothetical protein OIO90_003931 [Microbotryomycetes sp. JL221]
MTLESEKGSNQWKYHHEHVEDSSIDSSSIQKGHLQKPARSFTPEEEKKLYRKVDLHLLPMLAILYLLSFMDRGNIGNARLAGLETDLNMSGNDYSIALSVFFITYCIAEVPANLALKKLRPSIWLASITIVWGIVMTLMGVVQNFGGLIGSRLALGIAEAGLFPGVIYYLTLWYPRHLSQQRVALFFSAATIAGAFSGLLAYGIGFMGGTGTLYGSPMSGWRWIFILEGLLTVIAGIVAFWALTDYPGTASWLSEEEKAWLIYRKATDSGVHGESDQVKSVFIKRALTDWQVWLATAFYMGVVTPLYAIGLFAPTLINALGGYTRPQVQLLTVPIYVAACIWTIVSAVWSDKMKKRFPLLMVDYVLCTIGLIMNLAPSPAGVRFAGLFFIAAGSYAGLPQVVCWLGNNLAPQTKRAIGSAFQIGVGNFAALISSNVYRDPPRFIKGHAIVMGMVGLGFITAPLYAALLKRENMKREKELTRQQGLPDSEKRVYTVQELRDLGDRAPEFVYTI